MTGKRYAFLGLLGAVLVICNVALFVVRQRQTALPEKTDFSGDDALQIQEQRVGAIRAAVGHESLETLVQNLNDFESYAFPGYHSQAHFEQTDFERVLSSRRTHRLVALLSTLSEEERRQKTAEICERLQRQCAETIDRSIRSYEDPKAPKNSVSVVGNKLALGATLFAMARFGYVDEIVDELRRMQDLVRASHARIKRREDLYGPNFAATSRRIMALDNAFHINVVAYAYEHARGPGGTRADQVSQLLSGLQRKHVPLTKWDARNSVYDVTHVVFGIPVKREDVVETITVYCWDRNSLPLPNAEESQLQLVQKVMALVDQESH